jgi:hypothetical protein
MAAWAVRIYPSPLDPLFKFLPLNVEILPSVVISNNVEEYPKGRIPNHIA